jgi:hypothetical protein
MALYVENNRDWSSLGSANDFRCLARARQVRDSHRLILVYYTREFFVLGGF